MVILQLLQECSTMERHCAPYQAAVMTTVPPEEPYDCMEDTSDTVLIEVMSNPHHCTMEQECSAGVNLEDESKDGTSHRSPAYHFSHTEGVVFDTHGTISTD